MFFLIALAFVLQLLKAGWDQQTRERERTGSARPRGGSQGSSHSGRDRMVTLSHALPRARLVRTGQHPEVIGRLFGAKIRVVLVGGSEVCFELEDEHLRDLEATIHIAGGELEVNYPGSPGGTARTASFLRQSAAKRALAALLHEQGLERVEIGGGSVRAWGSSLAGRRLAPSRAKRVLHDLRRLSSAAEALDFVAIELKAAPKAADWSERTCPFCHDDLSEGDRVGCEACDTVHHADCFEEIGRCTTLGCAGLRAFPISDDPQARSTVRIDGTGCPECGLHSAGCTPGGCQGGLVERVRHHRRTRA